MMRWAVWAAALCAAPTFAAAQDFDANGIVVSERRVTVSSQLSARITEMPFGASDGFEAGDVLVRFDCARLKAEREGQAARLDAATQRHAINTRLGSTGSISKGDLIQSQSEADIAAADLRALDASLKDCQIIAPFTGRVVETFAEASENAAPSQELMTLVDHLNLEVELIVPSVWLSWLKTGEKFEFRLYETERAYPAEVSALGAVIDPVSRTVRLTAQFSDAPASILPGMSGRAVFARN